MSSENELRLEWFPTEVLRLIFGLCDAKTLARLCQTCRRFNEIISEDALWRYATQSAIISCCYSKILNARCFTLHGMREHCRISHNWKIGKYDETFYWFGSPRQKTRFMPWLWVEGNRLWLSKGQLIEAYSRRSEGYPLSSRPATRFRGADQDISRFLIRDGLLVSGGRDGGLYGWDCRTQEALFLIPRSHNADVHDVEICQDLLFSASRDASVKIWKLPMRSGSPMSTVHVGDRVLCVSASSQAGLWCCGSSGVLLDPLHVFDINIGAEVTSLGVGETGAGLLDVTWDTPQSILSCGYDASLKLWDLRVDTCVRSWEDPHDSTLYCLCSDGKFSVMCGASRHGRVQLWDRRHDRSLQMYYAQCCHSSPVYSLTFDRNMLYVALDQSLNCLDFSTRDAAPHNFRHHT